MWKTNNKKLNNSIIESIIFGTYIIILFKIGVWSMTYGQYVRYLLFIAFFFFACKAYSNIRKYDSYKSKKYALFVLTGVFIVELLVSESGSQYPKEYVELDFPLKNGKFCVVQGGSNEIINHHFPVRAQKYALDIVQINSIGHRKTSKSNNLTDYYIFNSNIYSPCDGVICDAVDQYKDLDIGKMDPENPAGNYISILIKDKAIVVLLAHLKKGSLRVKKGDLIRKGQVLAKVGNTGNTSEPHLHIHSIQEGTGDLLFSGLGIPMLFNRRFLIRNDTI